MTDHTHTLDAFAFDTSGVAFAGLTPFAQGYTKAAARSLYEATPAPSRIVLAFSMFAAETLERIVADCALAMGDTGPNTEENGAAFWGFRQNPLQARFLREVHGDRLPPLTVALNDSGQVVFQ